MLLTFSFRRQCFLDTAPTTAISLLCPSCSQLLITNSTSGRQQILSTLTNEGGTENSLDMLPHIMEEAYLIAHPGTRKARAFMQYCGEGDILSIISLLGDEENGASESEPSMSTDEILRYQDPLNGNKSALHVAVFESQETVAWLLLYLASSLSMSIFPPQVIEEASAHGLVRDEGMIRKVDIRQLKDVDGETSEQKAQVVGGVWRAWIAKGLLKC